MVVFLLVVLIIVVALGHHCHECEAKEAARVQREREAWDREHPDPAGLERVRLWLEWGEQPDKDKKRALAQTRVCQCGHRVVNPQAHFCGRCGVALGLFRRALRAFRPYVPKKQSYKRTNRAISVPNN